MAKKYFNLKLPKRPWLRGGVIGAAICVLLFLFYLFVYFPVIEKVYAKQIASEGTLPAWTTALPIYTGHLLVVFYLEPVPYSVAKQVCPKNPTCFNWVAADFAPPDCQTPWKIEDAEMEGQIDGCCLGQDTEPVEPCGRYVRNITSTSIIILFITIYFLIGAGIGWFVGRRKKR